MAKRVRSGWLSCGSHRTGGRAKRLGGNKAGAPQRQSIRSSAIKAPVAAIIVATNALLREGLTRMLSAANFRIIASVRCADAHVLSTLPQKKPILLIIDMSNDFEMGSKQVESFKQRYPRGRVVVLADQHQLDELVAVFQVGANACLAKAVSRETFIKCVELVMLGGTFLSAEVLTLIHNWLSRRQNVGAAHASEGGETPASDVRTNKRVPQVGSGYAPRLSPRQQSILHCLVQGDSNKTIARKMALAEATVKVHVKAIFRNIRVHNRTEAAIWAKSNGSVVTADNLLRVEKLPTEPLSDANTYTSICIAERNAPRWTS
ncbi:MAG: hypothetical protein AUG51_12820 [Acidobacteria bacterium 13_1_20CM_3_53_8]|nr:MAG: hypothetical protein AUG51_12820 [Acidobacteria bacterium 13_1_20CM_3_53_8]